MKILVISHEYPPIGGGGGRVVQELSYELASRGHWLYLLTAHYGELPRIEEYENLTIERLPSLRSQPFRADFKAMSAFVIRSFIRGLKIMRTFEPDLIHAHFAVPAGATARLLSLITGIPYIVTAHGGDVPGGAPEKTARWFRVVLPFSKPVWKRAAAVVAVSRQTRDLALEHYDVKIRVIPNGINIRAMKPTNLAVNSPPKILFIGRFSPEKNPSAVPAILAKLKHLEWKCEMLGDGVEMDKVRRLIEGNGLSERVNLAGWVKPEDVQEHMSRSDILLMPSLHEGMPIAALQGLAMGLALLLPNKGSCPDLIKDNGFLLPPGDQLAYTQALQTLLVDKELLAKFKKNSRAFAAKFAIDKTADAYEQLMNEVVHQGVG